jgi:hypothetical protein
MDRSERSETIVHELSALFAAEVRPAGPALLVADLWYRVYVPACEGGLGQTTRRVVVLGDGAEWIWNRAAHFVGGPRVEVVESVDIYHAYEHRWAVGRALGHARGGQRLGRTALATPSMSRARPPCWPSSTRSSRPMPRPRWCRRRAPTLRTTQRAWIIRALSRSSCRLARARWRVCARA